MVEQRSPGAGSPSPRVQALLERYIEERLSGGSPDPEVLCRGSPELRAALESCIREYEELRGGLAPTARSSASEAATEDLPEGLIVPGLILGDRYQIRSRLGRGGMGEVWRAFDLKLRVEVALKALVPERFRDERRRRLLRREVRAAREVVSPNVCRIFDLIEVDGVELVSMEYVDGDTLLEHLSEHSPLDLKQAQEIASQFLAGLEAIHQAGLVHRDVKPENIMLTRSGRVVLMDFGLARGTESGAGTVSGTPAYMAPEQAAGLKIDARADLYSAGVVLAEMITPEGVRDLESRQSVWEGIRQEPVQLADSPWASAVGKAVAKERNERYESVRALTRALEDVTLRVVGADDLTPYPGLAAFTEEDAEYFFGREAEVEAMWAKLEGPARLLGLVGPSGAGKTSFLRAGVIPNAPPEWGVLRCTPGSTPMGSLRRALVGALRSDTEALGALALGEDEATISALSRWSSSLDRALLVVDQFEELFTLNSEETQARCAELLGRLPVECDIHVVLAMRDDFLVEAGRHASLRSLIPDLTLLYPPTGPNLRRALVQPTAKCGYRFEEDGLVDEMLAEVEGERGALPLLAFSMARLWERRDRNEGLITRSAHEEVGGVGGALARHAEATLERIGSHRLPLVRELFRNLVTAERTRAVCEWVELVSVFKESDRGLAENVLRHLVDARLLTSYEVEEEEQAPSRRVEIIHESLLVNWPRLVRWQTQDADAAQLRDEVRQAARAWDEHDRSNDRLWTGSAYREFELWRERYPGGLSEVEGAFASAMTSLANRTKRRRRVVVATVLVLAVLVTTVTTALWRRSVVQERRAEAQKLMALGQVRLEDYPTAALAHATKSLELADSEEARFLAMEALWKGPTAFVVNDTSSLFASFSPDMKWLVQSHDGSSSLAVISPDGRQRVVEHPAESSTLRLGAFFQDSEDFFTSWIMGTPRGVAFWSASKARLLSSAVIDSDSQSGWRGAPVIDGGAASPRAVLAERRGNLVTVEALHVDGSQVTLGEVRMETLSGEDGAYCLDLGSGAWLAVVEGQEVSVLEVGDEGLSGRRLLGRHEGEGARCLADPLGRFFLTFTSPDEIRRWDPSGELGPTILEAPSPFRWLWLSKHGSYLVAGTGPAEGDPETSIWSIDETGLRLIRRLKEKAEGAWDLDPVGLWLAMRHPPPVHRLWSLAWPAGAEPILLRRGPAVYTHAPEFSPDGRWLATNDMGGLLVWPLERLYPAVLPVDFQTWSYGVKFSPDGSFLSACAGAEVRVWPLVGPVPAPDRVAFEAEGPSWLRDVTISPDSVLFAVGENDPGEVWIGKDGETPRRLSGDEELRGGVGHVTFSPDGRFVAARDRGYDIANAVLHVWEVATGKKVAVLRLEGAEFRGRYGPGFVSDGRLLIGSSKGVVAFDVATGEHEVLVEGSVNFVAASRDGRRLLVTEQGRRGFLQEPAGSPVFYDLDRGVVTPLATHGSNVMVMALDAAGAVAVTGDGEGGIRVGPVTGEEPHLFLGHEGAVLALAIDPLGRFIASASQDKTVRLWPMPDLSKPALHTLPREELIAKLKTLTNLRVARDETSATGWTLTHDPFPGWETVPTW